MTLLFLSPARGRGQERGARWALAAGLATIGCKEDGQPWGAGMIRKLLQATVLVASGWLLLADASAAPPPAKKPPAPDYQAPFAASPASTGRGACYSSADLTVVRARMLHQELVVATLQCQYAGGVRAFEAIYGKYNSKFAADLVANAQSLKQLAGRRGLNVDVLVTEFSNRTAQRPPIDRDFCSRAQRALEWATDPKATSLALVPPPYDLGPEMNIVPCP